MAESAVKRIGVLTSGGDAPGMNAAVRSVVRSALDRGIECIGIRRGWSGLINGDFYRMDSSSVSRLVVGMNAQDAIERMKGIHCGPKPTSCPDQMAHALEEALAAERA